MESPRGHHLILRGNAGEVRVEDRQNLGCDGRSGKMTSSRSARASGEHQMTRRGSRTAQWAFAFALRAFLFSRFNARPKRSVTHEQNEGQKSSTGLIGLEFWRILVDLRAAVGRDVFTSPHQLASSLQTGYTNVMNGFATHWMLRGATVSNHCRRSSVNPVWRHLNADYPPEGVGDTGSAESAGTSATRTNVVRAP